MVTIPRISVIGSCRVHNPMRKIEKLGMVELNNYRLTEFCHTAREAMQKIRVANNRLQIPENIYPLVFGYSHSSVLEEFRRSDFSNTDLFVIEVSSVRRLTFLGYELQLNFVMEYLIKPYKLEPWLEDISRKARHAKNGAVVRSDSYLERAPINISEILSNIEMSLETDHNIQNTIHQISSYLQKPILFVGHFNITKTTGGKVADRDRLNKCLHKASIMADEYYFDPMEIIDDYTREVALRDDNHWNYDFEIEAGNEIYNRSIAKIILGMH